MVLPMNTGAEAVETAMKVARKWAYKIKGVEENKAIILSVTENFHGRTYVRLSLSLSTVETIWSELILWLVCSGSTELELLV